MKFSATVTLQYPTIFSTFSAENYVEGLDWIRDSGLDGAELCISHYRGLDLGLIRAQLQERGLGCSTLSTGQSRSLEGLSLIDVTSDIRKKTQQRLFEHIDAAAYLGSRVTIGLLRGLGSAASADRDRQELAEALKPVIDHADNRGVILCLEAINRYETALLNSAEATMDFIENELGNPDCVGILWDLFHANLEDADLYACIELMGKKLAHVHLADSNRMFPGYGHTDIKGILKAVKESGYTGYASFECLNLPDRDTVLRETGRWVESIRQL